MYLVHHIIKKFFRRISLFCQDWHCKPVPYTRMVLSGLLTCSLLATPLFVKSNRYSSIPLIGTNQTGALERTHSGSVSLFTTEDFLPNLKSIEFTSFGDKLYGMTYRGGSSDKGMIFSLDPATNTYSVVRSFTGKNNDGANPTGKLTEYNNKLYGVTQYGGIYNRGTVFSLDPTDSSSYTVLKTTGMLTLNHPIGSLTNFDNMLYGMLSNGGSNIKVFTLDPRKKNLIREIKDMSITPLGSLTEYNNKLYGVFQSDADSFYSTLKIFTIDPELQVVKPSPYNLKQAGKDASFPVSDTAKPRTYTITVKPQIKTVKWKRSSSNVANTVGEFRPISSLTVCKDTLYGYGLVSKRFLGETLVFSLDPTTDSVKVIKVFRSNDKPSGSLIVYEDMIHGMTSIYGMTSEGGKYGKGVIFLLDPVTNTYEVLKEFTGKDGSNPHGSLTLHHDKLYGMTSKGGHNGNGVFFTFDPTTDDYTFISIK